MKLKENFVLRQVADTWVVLPIAEATLDFNGMITLNETGAVLWRALEQGADAQGMVEALTSEYDVSADQAAQDIEDFLAKLLDAGCIQE